MYMNEKVEDVIFMLSGYAVAIIAAIRKSLSVKDETITQG